MSELSSKREERFEVIIPDNTPPKDVVLWSRLTSSLIDKHDSEGAILLQAAGRLHYLARTSEAVLQEAECKTIAEYEERILGCKNHRVTLYKYSTAYGTFPGLTPAMAAEIGSTNLVIASKAAKDASPKQKRQILAKATLPTKQFREYIEQESGISGPGETSAASFELMGTKAQISELREWLADHAFVEWAESDQPIAMILAAIQTASTEFTSADAITDPPMLSATEEYAEDEPAKADAGEDW